MRTFGNADVICQVFWERLVAFFLAHPRLADFVLQSPLQNFTDFT
jgi:hypothetical protein